jgi:hypothetical protein
MSALSRCRWNNLALKIRRAFCLFYKIKRKIIDKGNLRSISYYQEIPLSAIFHLGWRQQYQLVNVWFWQRCLLCSHADHQLCRKVNSVRCWNNEVSYAGSSSSLGEQARTVMEPAPSLVLPYPWARIPGLNWCEQKSIISTHHNAHKRAVKFSLKFLPSTNPEERNVSIFRSCWFTVTSICGNRNTIENYCNVRNMVKTVSVTVPLQVRVEQQRSWYSCVIFPWLR